jgi:hypothetical protein
VKTGTLILVGIVLATVAYQVVERVPSDTLSVALGVACGIAASIPVTVGLMIALWRRGTPAGTYAEMPEPEIAPRPMPYRPTVQPFAPPQLQPPQIIVLSPQGQFTPGQLQDFPLPAQWAISPNPFMHEQANAVDAREWRIIGTE